MLDLKFVRDNFEMIKTATANRKTDVDLTAFSELDETRRQILPELESLRARRNQVSAEVAKVKKSGGDPSAVFAEMKEVGGRIKTLEEQLKETADKLDALLLTIPNPPHESVPLGESEDDNPVVSTWGEPRQFDFEPLNHWDIGENLGILDFATAAKRITGSRFAVLKLRWGRQPPGASPDRLHARYPYRTEHGYTEVLPPFMVQRRFHDRHGPAAQVRGVILFKLEGCELLPGPHGRGAGDQHPPGRHPVRRADLLPISYTRRTRPASGPKRAATARTCGA